MPRGTDEINAKVKAGAKSFDVFEDKLEKMLVSLKKQHASMVSLSNNRLEVSTTYC